MALSHPTLGDVLGLTIKKDEPVKCLFILKEEERQCRHPIAKTKCNKAYGILQYQVTFQDDEYEQIEDHVKELANLLIHDNNHKESGAEKKAYQAKWLNMWLTRAGQHRQIHENSLVRVNHHHVLHTSQELVEIESSDDDSLEEDNLLESPTSTSAPAITYRPHLLQGTPAITYRSPPLLQDTPAPEPAEIHSLPAPPSPCLILNGTELSNNEIIKKEDEALESSEAYTTPRSSALGVFMSPSQRMIFQSIIKTISEFLLAYRMRISSNSTTNEAGHVKRQSAFELDMLLRVRIPMSGSLSSVYAIIVLQVVTSHIFHTLFGVNFKVALLVVMLGWPLMWLSRPRQTQTRKIQA